MLWSFSVVQASDSILLPLLLVAGAVCASPINVYVRVSRTYSTETGRHCHRLARPLPGARQLLVADVFYSFLHG
ncbi:hypothetical protein C8F04DRAFT_155635 [Mycena alexandri]|uniref:Uncharacterized protein n=1 Tax=Mycena alexandri TaxID=1745969 RepID=A0AAD6SD45_9AGAR|nr:hypothetical protein C8F04DRAFT_155635 [Mycena alexandri]